MSRKLSIQVSLNGLSFCSALVNNQEIIALEHQNFGIQLTPEQVLDKIKYNFNFNKNLKYDFESIEVIYQNDLYTVVPQPLFDEKFLKEYLRYNTKVLSNDFIAYDTLNQHDLITVYVPLINVNNFFFDTFGAFTYKHSTTILMNSLLAQEKNSESTSVFVNICNIRFDLIVINKGNLLLCNTFMYDTKEDFLYYLMFTTEQLGLNPEEFELIFLGEVSDDSDFFTIAYKYIRNIRFGKRHKNIKLTEDLNDIQPHEHYALLSHF
ncbi:DUF3822 family protein [Aquimarina pacifica]|uniref:DUF3822 family protein n=1 Tax=Aquimarina pacifica TaxID=1296415 RepID=UPI0004B0DDE2|nr:DUF3822 family protein [Aquimarina pacifica]